MAAAPAAAAPTLVTTASDRILGPALAGERVFFGDIGSGDAMRLTVAGPGEGRRRLDTASVPGASGDDWGEYLNVSAQLAGSADRLAFSTVRSSGNARYQQGSSSLRTLGGTPTGALAQLESCGHSDPYSPASTALDVDGVRTASTNCNGHIVIREGDTTVATVSPGQGMAAATIALAGRYVAYNHYGAAPNTTTPNVTIVHDWVTNTKVYEVPRQGVFDLQADGKLASVAVGSACGRAQWFSPAEPTEHLLPVQPCTNTVRMANDRIAVVTSADGGQRRITLAGTDGSVTHVANLGTAAMAGGAHDYDGQRVAYSMRNCVGRLDLLTESATAPAARAEDPTCPAVIRSGSDSLGPRDAHARFLLRCELGCRGSAFIRMRINKGIRLVGSRTIRLSGGGSCDDTSVRVRLNGKALRELREHGARNADLRVLVFDRAGTGRIVKRRLRLRSKSTNDRPPRDCAV